MVLGRYNLVLLGIKWYWVNVGPVYIEKVDIWSGVTIVGRTNNEQGKIELLSHWTMEG